MKFIDKLKTNLTAKNSHLCVGLDSRYDNPEPNEPYCQIPSFIKSACSSKTEAILTFNKKIIEQTHDLVVCYKMNLSFYAAYGHEGLEGLFETNKFLKENYPDIQIFADCKRSEMGGSVKLVAAEIFDWLKFDCVMVTPWFGFDTMRDYFDDITKGVVVYIHDSNPSAKQIQDLLLKNGRRVYEEVARLAAKKWNRKGNLIAEAGVTYPKQLRKIRKIIGEEMPLLVAGIGAQGGKIEKLIGLFGMNSQRLIANSSRDIIFAGKEIPEEEAYFKAVRTSAIKLRDELRQVAEN